MSAWVNFSWPTNQNITVQFQVSPPTSISLWSLRFDLMYRQGSPNPLWSAFATPSFNNVSGINITNSAQGIYTVALPYSIVSGVYQSTNVLAYTTRRTDVPTDIAGGLVLLPPY